eukprot:gene33015-42149_t
MTAISQIPMLADNYGYLVVDRATKQAALVDPCDAQSALTAVQRAGASLTMLLITHHHADHAGGNLQIKQIVPGVEVICGEGEDVPGMTRALKHRENIWLGNTRLQGFETPFHTDHHMVFGVHPSTTHVYSATELHIAAATGDIAKVEELLRIGCHVDQRDE